MKDYQAAIASKVKGLREEQGMQQLDITMRSGIAPTTVSKIERNGAPFTLKTAYLMAHALGCTIHDLIPAESKDMVAEAEARKQ
jgi:transcriptional regulator with XRE-family HTH domain